MQREVSRKKARKTKENNRFRKYPGDMDGIVALLRSCLRRVSGIPTCSIQTKGYNQNLSVNINIDYFTYANGDER
jgi:hypothetical protein